MVIIMVNYMSNQNYALPPNMLPHYHLQSHLSHKKSVALIPAILPHIVTNYILFVLKCFLFYVYSHITESVCLLSVCACRLPNSNRQEHIQRKCQVHIVSLNNNWSNK